MSIDDFEHKDSVVQVMIHTGHGVSLEFFVSKHSYASTREAIRNRVEPYVTISFPCGRSYDINPEFVQMQSVVPVDWTYLRTIAGSQDRIRTQLVGHGISFLSCSERLGLQS